MRKEPYMTTQTQPCILWNIPVTKGEVEIPAIAQPVSEAETILTELDAKANEIAEKYGIEGPVTAGQMLDQLGNILDGAATYFRNFARK
jgi:hypothetical protein